jgi:cytochrome c-type biogenesis protein CcmF
MPTLGSFALLLSLALASYNFVLGAIAQRQILTGSRGRISPERLAKLALLAGRAGFVAISAAVFALLWAIFSNDFSLAYVLHESSRALPGPYKFAALWSGQEGSLLLWAWLLSGDGFIVRLRHKTDDQLTALASTILAVPEIFFLLLLNFVALPFAGVSGQIPADGAGMNPLLQYPEMVIHPPLLYLGFVGFSVPFAFALGALMLRSPAEAWIPVTRRWAMISWLFLTCGIVLGMHWAYVVLGWGGYWGWDPVENASLMPWLTGTAFLHSSFMQEKRGMMKNWNIWLIFSTFLLCVFGTLLTRSGIVSSVHAFGESSIGTWFWAFLALTLLVCAITFLARLDDLRSEHQIESFVSRESSFLFNNLILLAACVAVFFGTLLPVITEFANGSKVTVGPPFYNRVLVPIGLFLLLLTGTAPLLGGRGATWLRVRKHFIVPGIAAAIAAAVLIACGIHPWTDRGSLYSLVCFLLSAFVITAIGTEFARGATAVHRQSGKSLLSSVLQHFRGNTRRHGAYIVHFGIVLMFIGFAGSAFNRSDERELNAGQSMDLGPYRLLSRGFTQASSDNYVAERASIDVIRGGKRQFQLEPETRLYHSSQTMQSMAASHTSPLWDLYLIYEGQNPDTGQPLIKAFLNPLVLWIWIGACIVIFGTLVALIPVRHKQQELTPPTIYLARHCKTEWNREGRVQGTMDIGLSPEGARDAELNLPAIRNLGIQQIVCSPAKRAMQTATIYAQALGVPLQSSPRFLELDHGEWEGQRIEDLLSLPNSPFKQWMADPGAVPIPGSSETALIAQQRILDGIRQIASTYSGKTVLLVAHKHILALLGCALNKSPLTQFKNEIVESTLPCQLSIEIVSSIRSATDSERLARKTSEEREALEGAFFS